MTPAVKLLEKNKISFQMSRITRFIKTYIRNLKLVIISTSLLCNILYNN